MNFKVRIYITLISIPIAPVIAFSQADNIQYDLPPANDIFHNFGNNLLGSFSRSYGLYHGMAIASSYGLIVKGGDWRYYEFMRDNSSLKYVGLPSVILGGLVPVAVPVYLYYRGKSDDNSKLMYTSYALGQSVIASMIVSSGYKAITGRKPPEIFDNTGDDQNDYSDDFNFGFFRRGIFDGWPSGHTTTAAAMVTTLIKMYPNNKFLKRIAVLYAVTIGAGVSTNIHWLSDAVAGGLIGYSIGASIGDSYNKLINRDRSRKKISLIPRENGLVVAISF